MQRDASPELISRTVVHVPNGSDRPDMSHLGRARRSRISVPFARPLAQLLLLLPSTMSPSATRKAGARKRRRVDDARRFIDVEASASEEDEYEEEEGEEDEPDTEEDGEEMEEEGARAGGTTATDQGKLG